MARGARTPEVGLAVAALLSLAAGCGGGAGTGGYPDAVPWGSPRDGAAGDGAGADLDDGGGDTRAPTFEPADATLTRLLVPFPGALVGFGTTSCTNAVPSRPDVWCAFSRPQNETDAASAATELWVFDFTQALAAGVLKCDGTDRGCLRLSTALWTGVSLEGPSHPTSHRFDGDTLIFHAGAAAVTTEPYDGPVWAWRPGWPEARPLTSDHGLSCTGDRRTPAIYCVDAALVEPTGSSFPSFRMRGLDLRAGRLGDTPLPAPLPLVDHLQATGAGDLVWQAAFTPKADRFVYSSATAGTDSAIVKGVAMDAAPIGTPSVLAEGAVDWRISYDGTRLYHRQGVDLDTFLATGRLAAVKLPPASGTEVLSENVIRYQLLGAHEEVMTDVDRGLLIQQDDGADDVTWSLLTDPSRPGDLVLFPAGAYGVDVATDLRHSLFYQDGANGQPVIQILRNDGTGKCSPKRDPRSETYGGHFSHTSRLVFWIEYRGDSEEGWYADPETCGDARKFGDYVTGFTPVGDDFVVFRGTDFDDSAYHLQYARLLSDGAATRVLPRMIDHDVDGSVVVLGSGGALHVLYGLSREDAPVRGIFVHGPLPR